MFWKFALRDLILLALCVLMWQINMSAFASTNLFIAIVCGTLTVVITVLTSYEGHEWGHLTGAVATGAVVHAPRQLIHQFLFHFDGKQNSRQQFVGMSIGGLAASVAVLILLLQVLPLSTWSAKIALGIIIFGIIVTFLREVPEAWRVHRGTITPQGPVYEPFAASK
jgi:membrane protein YdbS with pleckstrin-like domain